MIKAVIFDMYETLITHYHGYASEYFSAQMAEDTGIPVETFRSIWCDTRTKRTTGELSLEDALTLILKTNNCYDEAVFQKVIEKRIYTADICFSHLHEEIVPMLLGLKEKGIKIGLISNCFSEEAKVIRESNLFSYFDALTLSYEQGVQKPDTEIYRRCAKELGVLPKECLYIGDGGSEELEAAKAFGMQAAQAVWYLKEGTRQPCGRKDGFRQVETPLEVLDMVGYEYIFFDLDGTLTDPGMGITNSVMYALKKFGIEETDRTKLYKFIGPPLLESFEVFYGFSEEDAWKALAYYREYFSVQGLYENEVYEGVKELLDTLVGMKKKIVLATSKPEEFAKEILRHFGLDKYFDFVAGATMDESRNKKDDVIEYALESLHITNTSSVLMIGDRKHDVLGAKKFDIDSIGVLYGYGDYEELTTAGATYIAETVEEIKKVIK